MSIDYLHPTSADTLTDAIADAAATIERALSDLLGEPAGGETRLIEAMRYACLNGGKRMRGFLVLEVATLFGVPLSSSRRAAASVEMLHAYSLVHDDLPAMDNDDLRRGQPSTHCKFDEATAILAGDALQSRAFEILAEPATHPDPLARCELVAALAAASGAHGMAGGQMIDMQAEGRQLTAAEITEMQALKTGCLIEYSARAGAILGRAARAERDRVAAYGRDLGTAFQIADDLLDAAGNSSTIGKTAGKDAAAGKATLVSLLGLEAAAAQARALSKRAAAHLDGFGPAARRLQDLASYAVTRGH